MFKEKDFNDFISKMEEGINENTKFYGDTWKKEDIDFLEHRLQLKYKEFMMTKKPSKLISLSNLAMMLYIRKINDED